jgi:hypothetical protein
LTHNFETWRRRNKMAGKREKFTDEDKKPVSPLA